MAGIRHKKTLNGADGTDNTRVQPSNWNEEHIIDDLTMDLNTAPGVPLADKVRLFGEKMGGRMMPAFVGPTGLELPLQPSIARASIGWWAAAGQSAAINVAGAASALTAVGTATVANAAVTNLHTKMKRVDHLVTTAATTAVAGVRAGAAIYCREIGYHLVMRGAPATGQATTATTGRFFIGVTNSVANPTDVAPSTQVQCIGVGFEGAATTLSLYYNDGTGTCTTVSLGTDFPRYTVDRATMYELALYCAPGAAGVRYEFTDLTTGKVASGEIVSSDQPPASTFVAPRMYASVGGTSSVIGTAFSTLYIETDY